jgi:serine/threonine protein phosphatase PrpC
VVADGAGEPAGGAEAAKAVLDAARALALAEPGDDVADVLVELDRILLARRAGRTTAVVLEVSETGIRGASVGDSGAWLVFPDRHVELTEDQRRKPLLGTGAAEPTRFFSLDWRGATILVASDGLFKYAAPHRICDAARDPRLDRVPESLVVLVSLPMGKLQDDVAIVACRRR